MHATRVCYQCGVTCTEYESVTLVCTRSMSSLGFQVVTSSVMFTVFVAYNFIIFSPSIIIIFHNQNCLLFHRAYQFITKTHTETDITYPILNEISQFNQQLYTIWNGQIRNTRTRMSDLSRWVVGWPVNLVAWAVGLVFKDVCCIIIVIWRNIGNRDYFVAYWRSLKLCIMP